MSPQHSNRNNLMEGTIRLLERLPGEPITARAIADESGANLASIAYHFGSKDELVTVATIEALDRWLGEVDRYLAGIEMGAPGDRLRAATEVIEVVGERYEGLSRNFLGALARAQHEPRVRELLANGFRQTRPRLAAILDLGDDQDAEDAAGLIHAMFVGLLFQSLLEPDLAIQGERMERAQKRLRDALPQPT